MPKKKKVTKKITVVEPRKEVQLQSQWSNDQIELIKKTVAVGATDDELKLFLYTASRTGLDPLTRQIFFVKRAGKVTIQTGIDGYRAIAERTGQLAGIDDPTYELGETGLPMKATVAVYRIVKNIRVPFIASARWNEYIPQGGQSFMWQKMPFLMLGKVAESLALRKAFPLNLSGLYTQEEMEQADNTIVDINSAPKSISSHKEYPQGDHAQDTYEQAENMKLAGVANTTHKKEVSTKTKIAHLCKLLGLSITDPFLDDEILKLTQLDVNKKENHPEIIKRLEFIYQDRKDLK